MSIGSWALLLGGAVLVFWAVGAYNRLVRLKNEVAAAFAQLDEHLARRREQVMQLHERVAPALSGEAAALESLGAAAQQSQQAAEQARAAPWRAGPLGALAGAEQHLAGCLQRVMSLQMHQPDLSGDAVVAQLVGALDDSRHRIGFARVLYNDRVVAFNAAIDQFPTVLLARALGFFPLEPLVPLP